MPIKFPPLSVKPFLPLTTRAVTLAPPLAASTAKVGIPAHSCMPRPAIATIVRSHAMVEQHGNLAAPGNHARQTSVPLAEAVAQQNLALAPRAVRRMAPADNSKIIVRDPLDLIAVLTAYPAVRTLVLHGKNRWNGVSLLPLQYCTDLRNLSIPAAVDLHDADLAVLSILTKLRRLSLTECTELSGNAMAHLANLGKLQRLELHGCTGMDDAGMASLAALPRLTALPLRHCRKITALGLVPLAELANLQALDLGFCSMVTDLTPVRSMARLQSLCLDGNCALEDKAFIDFVGSAPSTLQRLDLAGCKALSDVAFAGLSKVPQLHTISLGDCAIGHAGVAALLALPNLMAIDARNCAGLAPADRQALQARPGLMRVQLD